MDDTKEALEKNDNLPMIYVLNITKTTILFEDMGPDGFNQLTKQQNGQLNISCQSHLRRIGQHLKSIKFTYTKSEILRQLNLHTHCFNSLSSGKSSKFL